ncbi:MAG: LytTR family DNA-binding domain-containing protein [Breznakibacter sp.]
MLKSVIIDDEIAARKSLEKIIEMYLDSTMKVEGSADNLKAGIQLIHKFKPDIVFLDIEMPMQSGLELFDYIDVNFDVVVISAYKDYAIEALRNGASDYLLKPVNVNELKQAINRIIEKRDQEQIQAEQGKSETGKLLLPCPQGFLVISHSEILAIEAEKHSSVIYRTNGDKIIVYKGLGEFEEYLPAAYFFRIHRSAIINAKFVTEINRETLTILINGTIKIPLASNSIKPLIEKLKSIMDVEFN